MARGAAGLSGGIWTDPSNGTSVGRGTEGPPSGRNVLVGAGVVTVGAAEGLGCAVAVGAAVKVGGASIRTALGTTVGSALSTSVGAAEGVVLAVGDSEPHARLAWIKRDTVRNTHRMREGFNHRLSTPSHMDRISPPILQARAEPARPLLPPSAALSGPPPPDGPEPRPRRCSGCGD